MRGQLLTVYRGAFKDLDGIDLDGQGNIIVSDFAAGKIYRIQKHFALENLRENMVTPAGFACYIINKRVSVPVYEGYMAFIFSPD